MTAEVLLKEFFPSAALPEGEIASITENTANADAQSVFVCIKGARADGHALSHLAYERGCRIFIAEHPLSLPSDATVLLTGATRPMLARLACAFYENPSHTMRVVGITGTKGKTTTAQLLSQILNKNGVPCGYVGTNGISFGDVQRATRNTTPDAVTLQRTLREMRDAEMQAVVIEVSSQALMQARADGTRFDTVAFTNLYSDHVGPAEHADLADYKRCKKRLFTDFGAQTAFWNADDPHTEEMRVGCTAPRQLTYAVTKRADCTAERVTPYHTGDSAGIAFSYRKTDFTLPLLGTYNASNALLAASIATEVFGIVPKAVANALSASHVEGRSEWIALPTGAFAVIDYAHNGESLKQALTALRPYVDGRLFVLFGSVGERSQLRRAELGRAACEGADAVIITSDNPGTEDPEAIMDEIARSFDGSDLPYYKIADRREAIEFALSLLQSGDVLLLAGKGHEEYQLIGKEKLPFSERAILAQYIKDSTAAVT